MAARFQVTSRHESIPLVELHDREADSRVVVAPSRGGMMKGFSVAGREIFFLNEATFQDSAQNVRGGNPILFPSPGKLVGDTWSWHGRSGTLSQHGFARSLSWDEQQRAEANDARVTLRLEAHAATLAVYPFPFTVELTYALAGTRLLIEQRVRNEGTEPMPFGFGFHPYFLVPQGEKARVRIPTAATGVFDNVIGARVSFHAPDLTADEIDWHLLDHDAAAATMVLPDGAVVTLDGSAEFTHWVIWTRRGHDFVCLEPWTCPGNALNSGERLIVLEPKEERTLRLAISYQPNALR